MAIFLISLNINAQQPVTFSWPLSSPFETAIASPYATLGFAAGKGVDSLRFTEAFGAMANSWNTDNQDPEAYFEYTLTPAPGTGIVLSRLNMEVSLSRVNMRTAIHYSLDGFKTSTQIGYTIFVGTHTPRNLPVKTSLSVYYPRTLSIRIYGWSTVDHLVDFHNRNVVFEGMVYGKDLTAETKTETPDEAGVQEPSVPEPENLPEVSPDPLAAMAVMPPQDTAGTQTGIAKGPLGSNLFTTSGTWLCPAGVTSVYAECWGAGGGAGNTGNAEGGGGGGAYAAARINVTSGTNYTVTVGAGGTQGNPGGNSSFASGANVSATGGAAGLSNGSGGTGGTAAASTGTVRFSGGNGGNREAPAGAGGGGGGSATAAANGGNGNPGVLGNGGTGGTGTGNGGNGGNTGASGANGSIPGGGGGGRGNAGAASGTGAGGQVIINYCAIFDLTGSGTNCSGTNTAISLSGSETGVNYQLYRGATAVGGAIAGTGAALNFGNQTIAGTYTVIATMVAGGATSTMNGSVIIYQTPDVQANPSTQTICPGTSITPIVLTNPNGVPGTQYAWTRDNTVIITGMASSGSGTPVTGTLSSSQPAVYTTTVFTITASANGCSSTTTASVVVGDEEKPEITCGVTTTQNQTTNNGCTYVHAGTGWDATATDDCSVASVIYNLSGATSGTGTSLNNIAFNTGSTTVTWTATDGAGNTSQCSFTVEITDDDLPVISCPVSGTQTVTTNTGCVYQHTGTGWDASATDNCSVTSLTYTLSGASSGTGTSLNGVSFNPGTTTVTWTATDAAGNSAGCSYTVAVSDDDAPVINCPVSGTQSVTTNSNCTYLHTGNGWNATATDNCGVTSLTYTLTGATTGNGSTLNNVAFNTGTTTVTWTASDAAGNTSQCSFTVEVTDDDLPVITCPVSGTQNVTTNINCTYQHTGTGWNATATDNCSVTSLTYTLTGATSGTGTNLNGVSFNQGTTTVTWTAADAAGNTASCSFSVAVTDDDLPQITCTGNQNVNTSAGVCTYNHSGTSWDATATDNCGTIASLIYTLSGVTGGSGTSLNGVSFNQGVTTVTWTATDAAGNHAECSFTVTVTDNEPPYITCPSSPQNRSANTGSCNYTVAGNEFDPVAWGDNCSGATITNDYNALSTLNGAVFPQGPTLVTWRVFAANGQNATCQFTVNISDDQAPVISGCPADFTVYTGPGRTTCDQTATWTEPTAIDNCGGPVTWTRTHAPGAIFPVGTTTVTYTATDGSGNTATCTFNVTVTDNTPPTFTVPPPVSIYVDLNCNYNAGIAFTGDVLNEFDNCTPTGLQAVYTDGPFVPGTCPGTGTITRTWSLTDNHGNTTTQTQLITIADNRRPATIFPPNITILCHQSTDPSVTGTATSTDNCGGPVTITYSDNTVPGTCASASVITRTWIATDCSGNMSSGNQIINVIDNVPPTATVANVTVPCPSDIPPVDITVVTASDNCGTVTTILYDEIPFGLEGQPGYCPTSVHRIYRVTDQCGNYTDVTQIITVTAQCGCSPCATSNSFYVVDLDGQPTGVTTIYDVERLDKCCDANKEQCVSFNVRIDEDAVGVEILIDGATPSPQDWRVDCENVEIDGDIICLPGGEFYLFTYCKPGANENDFTFRSIAGVVLVGELTTRVSCNTQIIVEDTTLTNPVWTSVWPGTPGQYNGYLSCLDCLNPIFTPDENSPPEIHYRVCGDLEESICNTTGVGCDTVKVYVLDSISVSFNVDPGQFCQGNIPEIIATAMPPDTYTFTWYNAYNGPNGTGSIVGTGPVFTPPVPGPYSLVVNAVQNDIPCSEYIYNFDVAPDDTPPTIYPPPEDLELICNDPSNAQKIQDWLAQAYAIDDHSPNIEVSNDFTGITQTCNSSVTVTFSGADECGNTGTATGIIYVIDTDAPYWTSAPGALDRSVECSDAAGLAAAQLLLPTAADVCDPASITLQKTTGLFVAGSCPQAGTYTNTWTATDLCGNVSNVYTQVITITDNTAPLWTTTAGSLNRTVPCDDAAALDAAQALMPAATDNCDASATVVKTAGPFVPGAICANAGTYTNTFVATDDCGNASVLFTQIITITDAGAPVIDRPAEDLTVECDGSGNTTDLNNWLNSQGGASAYDLCGGEITWTNDFSALSDLCGATGAATVTFTAADVCGNTASTTATFTIVDTQAPSITCPADVTAQINTVDCTVEDVELGNATAGDACSATGEIVITNNTPAAFPPGVTIVTWTATDACGNSATCTQTVTVEDLIPPTVDCPIDVTVNADPGVCQANVTVPSPNVTDPCPYTVTNNYTGTANASGIYPVGITIVTWTITGISGNVTTCEQEVTVVDTQAPSITCPDNQLFTAPPPDCELIVTAIPDPVLTDNCDVNDLILTWTAVGATPESGTGSVNGTVFPVGVTTVVYTVTDLAGNTAQCSFTVTINDQVPPTIITCPADITVDAEPDKCSADIIVPEPVVDDPCGEIVSVTNDHTGTSNASGTYYAGTTLVTWTITDASGNTTTCVQTIIVVDNQFPVIECPEDVYAEATPPDCEVPDIILEHPVYSDNCDDPVLTWSAAGATPGSGSGFVDITTFNVGTTVITYVVTDVSGNATSCSFNVVVNDDVPPTIVACPPDITQNADAGSCETYVTVPPPDVFDPCGEIVAIAHDSPYGISPEDASGTYPVGIHEINWTFTDESNNTNRCTQIITIVDNQFPSLTCPPDVTAIATPPDCEVPDIVLGLPTFSDNCPDPVLTWVATGATTGSGNGVVTLTTFNVGTTTITYTVTDASNNVTTCSFTVIVNDEVPPTVITCPEDISVAAPAGFCEIDLTVPAPVVDDPCQEIVTVTHNSPYGNSPSDASGTYPVGVYNITWTFTDESGNESYCYQEIEVIDNQVPVFTFCPPDVLAEATPPDCEVPDIVLEEPTYSDNCEDPVLTWVATGATPGLGAGFVNLTTFNVGTTVITYTLTDASGNTATCTFNVVVNDDVPPTVVTCPPDINEFADPGSCEVYINVPAPDVYDPCGEIVSITHNSPVGTPEDPSGIYPVGVYTITWTFTDESGNTSTCPQTITVIDDQLPVIDCPDDVTAIAEPPLCEVPAIIVGDPVYADNCPDPVLTWEKTGATTGTGTGLVNNTPFNVGVTTVTYTVTDASGNEASCSFTVTVNDQVPPTVITCPADETVNAPADACEAYIEADQPVVTDPCGEIVSWTHNSTYGISPTDASGTYPVGVHTVTWTFTDNSGNTTTCEQIITVVDVTPPTLTCPPDFTVPADFGLPYAADVPIPAPTYSDACDVEYLSWVMTGATTGSSAPPPPGIQITLLQTLNVGTTTFTYTATDYNGLVSTCSFDVTVLSEPEIDCPADISVNTDPGVCSATLDPGQPILISGAEPITWTYTITNEAGDVIGSGTCTTAGLNTCIGPFTFPVGVNTITWTATNISGFDECVQTITVTDNEAPTFTAPGPFDFCVINIISAQYDGAPEPAADIIPLLPEHGNPRRPDWYLVGSGSTELDITGIADNCCAPEDLDIAWTITFDPLIGGTLSGIGQPSLITPIQLWGTATNVEVNHTITYTVTDCNGNEAAVVTRNILVRPRPEVIKQY